MKTLKKILKVFIWVVIIVVLIPVSFFIYSTLTDYKPNLIEKIETTGKGIKTDTTEFSLISWNIGYCGMGKEQDFFFDGGKDVRPDETYYNKCQKGILDFIASHDTTDFCFIQEIDIHAKRSYWNDQLEKISALLPNRVCSYAKNYDVRFVPFPLASPMGRVKSGLATFSKYIPTESTRHAFTSNFSWPKRIFMLDRCFILTRFPLKFGQDLVLINTHNSAFDNTSELRKQELSQLKEIMMSEYAKGNYVIVGGDWNQNPKDFLPEKIKKEYASRNIEPPMDENFVQSDFHWVFDPTIPTNRDADTPYQHGKTKATIIDFFLTTPNVEIVSCKTIETGFEFSDHQPIYLKFRLEKKLNKQR